jgi:hypothetical protein
MNVNQTDDLSVRCAIYARHSSEELSQESVSRQIQSCREAAVRLGFVIPDDGVVGGSARRFDLALSTVRRKR